VSPEGVMRTCARRRALRAVASVAARREPPSARDSADLQRRLTTVPGIGRWTAAEVVQRVFGCPDTVSYGDYHLKNQVGFALTGAARTDDDAMMALLEPWTGQRQRVVRLLLVSGTARAPRFGPRNAPTDHRRI
ncbi:MAG: DNA-3-methyladenine glycosylase 2 family protein, partial [Blastococcus sp.]|nr:DNA-3-methyladenine glycosylase 2 family protein [Blastococcus sp.]